MTTGLRFALLTMMISAGVHAQASDVLKWTQQEKPSLGPNNSTEPRAKSFSLRRAINFSDKVAYQWGQKYSCVTCHTNGLYLIARAGLAKKDPPYRSARDFAQEYLDSYVVKKKRPSGQRGAVEGIVATTCFLTISDMQTTKRLGKTTRKALKHMWAVQDADGSWGDWLKCGWPPFESDDHFGVTLAAIAVGTTPSSYRRTKEAKLGTRRLLKWLKAHPPKNLHHKGMMMWAGASLKGIVDVPTRKRWTAELIAKQRKDGGWRLADLGAGAWKRPKDVLADLPSDAYATAFAVLILRKAGLSADKDQIARGLAWLRQEQRESGRWFVRSPKRDGKHFISHAATMFSLMAFQSCGERPSKPEQLR